MTTSLAALLWCAALCLGVADGPGQSALQFAQAVGQADDLTDSSTDTTETERGVQTTVADELHVGGALRFNAFYKSWEGQEANRSKFGDFDFDTFRVNVDGTYQGIDLSLEYRLYNGYSMLHHGYFGYSLSDTTEMHVGVSRKPLGIMPYASHNWFFNITYYLGMEDDYDAGIKFIHQRDAFDLQLAFYKNDEGSYTGNSTDSARYSYDVVRTNGSELAYAGVTTPRTNEEVNQLNGRLTYTLSHAGESRTELGFSGEVGGLYNATTDRMGHHRTLGGHLNGTYGRWNVMLEALDYAFRPENPAGQDRSFVVMGAYDAPYKVAADGSIYMANVAYTLPVESDVIDNVTFYNNYSHLAKSDTRFVDSQQDVLGALVAAGKVFTYIDFAFGKNHPWIGADYGVALAEGNPDARWNLRFNINLGYYF